MKFLWGLISMTGLLAVSYQLLAPANEYLEYAEDVITSTSFRKNIIKPIKKLKTVKQINNKKFSKYKIPSRFQRLMPSALILKNKVYKNKSPLQDSALIPISKKPIKKKSYAADFLADEEDNFNEDPDLDWDLDKTLARAEDEKYPGDRAKEIKSEMEQRRLASVQAKKIKDEQNTAQAEDLAETDSVEIESVASDDDNDSDDNNYEEEVFGNNGIAAINADNSQHTTDTTETVNTTTGTTTTSSSNNPNTPSILVTSHETEGFINSEVVDEVIIKGTCSHSGVKVLLLVPIIMEVDCVQKKWQMTIDFSEEEEGELSLLFKHKSLPLNLRLVKDTIIPELNIDQEQNQTIAIDQLDAFQISGNCIDGNEELIGNELGSEIICEDEEWNAFFDFSEYSTGEHTIKFSYTDLASNTAESEFTFNVAGPLP
jgi:hypothetical protein